MRIFGLDITRAKKSQLTPVPNYNGGWRRILEPFAGAWQANIEETRGDLLQYPTLYACINRINQDIGKLPYLLKQLGEDGVWRIVENPAFSPVLRKPNTYQTSQQLREAWMLSKLLHGNTYVLKGRDDRGVVTRLYVLDPCSVLPMISDTGDVFYQIHYGRAENLLPEEYPAKQIIIPAREIIHDRLNTFHHQLIGVPPLCAAYWPTVKNLKILKNAANFFNNGATPGGILTAPAGMSDEDATRVKTYWDENFTGEKSGKVAVIGADMKFTSFAFKSVDSQMVEQMRYSDEQICQPFGVPPFKVGIGSIPAGLGVDAINMLYHEGALSGHIEAMENLLDEALQLPPKLGIWLDTDPLFRMDEFRRAEVESKLVGGKIKTPDEARIKFNLAPTGGGDTLWGQNQDYPLGMLANREEWDPAMQPAQPAPVEPSPVENETDKALTALWRKSPESFSHV